MSYVGQTVRGTLWVRRVVNPLTPDYHACCYTPSVF
jgi:hypothetical protein